MTFVSGLRFPGRQRLRLFIVIALPVAAFLAASQAGEAAGIVAAIAGLVVGFVLFALIARYGDYLFRAAQIAMIARGVSDGELPADTYAAGKQAVKDRFATASAYFALYAVTKAISTEITAGINALTAVAGGARGAGALGAAGSVAPAAIGIVLEYLNYCSLGWVFLHREQSAFKSTCDGAVIYFQNWKVLLKNAGKVLGLTVASLVVIGGAFFGILFLVLGAIAPRTGVLADIDASIVMDDGAAAPAGTSLVVLCVIVALLLWGGIHSAFVQPYLLVSVMRRYIDAGRANPPKVDLYGKLCSLSKGFRKALGNAEGAEGGAA